MAMELSQPNRPGRAAGEQDQGPLQALLRLLAREVVRRLKHAQQRQPRKGRTDKHTSGDPPGGH
jgi:hypothetical protein